MISFKNLRGAVGLASAMATATLITACGGGNGDDLDMPEAYALWGQADFKDYSSNRGSTVSDLSLASPLGGIATDGAYFYIADYGNNRILGFTSIPDGEATEPDFVIGQDSYTTSTAATSATGLAQPSSVVISDGKLIVADSGNNRVLIWNSLPTENDAADVILGQSEPDTKVKGTSDTALSNPVSAYAASGTLVVSDQNNNRVLIWDDIPSISNTAADVVLGQESFTTSDEDDGADAMYTPAGVWTDGFRLLVADSGNNRVLYWSSMPDTDGEEANFVMGQSDFSRSTAGVGQTSMRAPYGVGSDGTIVYVADSGNNRVLQFDAFPIANEASADDVFGQNTYTSRAANDDDQDGSTDSDPTEASDRTLNAPTGVTAYGGTVYISDRSNHRIMFFPSDN